ncbi:MAG TPA: RNA polymerase sigma factor [Flavobacteriales bacterium]|nr:RNA polymerase sigma factor [Flavobacteriales bacterium]
MEALRLADHGTEKLSDQQVVASVLGGQKGLYEILVRRHNRTLYRAVRSYLREPADVQDAMQDTYLKAYEKLGQFRSDAAFATWLVRIGINEALQRLKRGRTKLLHVAPDTDDEHLTRLPDTDQMDPEQRAIQQEHNGIIERAIDRLPETYRVVYMLREVEGMGVTDVAAALSISESNVKVRLHRAKALLKEAVWELHAGAPAFEFGNSHCDRMVALVMARI